MPETTQLWEVAWERVGMLGTPLARWETRLFQSRPGALRLMANLLQGGRCNLITIRQVPQQEHEDLLELERQKRKGTKCERCGQFLQ